MDAIYRKAIIIVGVVTSVGVLSIVLTRAAANVASVEPELGTISGKASMYNNSSASGNSAVSFSSNSTNSPSGQAMPIGNLTNWTQIFTEDFNSNVNEGNFPGTTYNTKWGVYPDGSVDTSAKIEGSNSRYYASRVLSVSNGILNKRLRTESINGIPTPLVATLTPLLPGTPPYNPNANGGWPPLRNTPTSLLYGRYSVRFRADSAVGFKTAWLLWPETETWPEDGEIDFPEGNLNDKICAFTHYQDATNEDISNGVRHQDSFCSDQNFSIVAYSNY